MRLVIAIVGAMLLVSLVVLPCSAFTIDNLTISVMKDGNATITLNYTLSILEEIVAFFKVVNPEQEIHTAVESASGKSADVQSVSGNSMVFIVPGYATTTQAGGTTTQTTPMLNFTKTQDYLQSQWWSWLASQDLSPTVSTVTFSDGFTQQYDNVLVIPSIVHALSG